MLTPLTGAGSFDGPRMLKAMQAVANDINGAGGVLGRKIELVVEDDETNPEAAVRAAHKLVDVDKVPVIMGTWASAVTTAVAPVCWESKTFLTTVSGADSITHLPHQGYLIRTQPNNQLAGDEACRVHHPAWLQARVHPGDPGAVRRADAEVSDGHADAEGCGGRRDR